MAPHYFGDFCFFFALPSSVSVFDRRRFRTKLGLPAFCGAGGAAVDAGEDAAASPLVGPTRFLYSTFGDDEPVVLALCDISTSSVSASS